MWERSEELEEELEEWRHNRGTTETWSRLPNPHMLLLGPAGPRGPSQGRTLMWATVDPPCDPQRDENPTREGEEALLCNHTAA